MLFVGSCEFVGTSVGFIHSFIHSLVSVSMLMLLLLSSYRMDLVLLLYSYRLQ